MLDHVFTDAIGALRDALETALLERQALEERFQTDILLGDVTWETSYGLPGEGTPPRVQVDLSLEWPTWSQTAYRTWYLHEEYTDLASIEIELAFRIQHLVEPPPPEQVLSVLPSQNPSIGEYELDNSGLIFETLYTSSLGLRSHAVELPFKGSCAVEENMFEDGSTLDKNFSAIGGWIASTLIRLGDLPLSFSPPLHD